LTRRHKPVLPKSQRFKLTKAFIYILVPYQSTHAFAYLVALSEFLTSCVQLFLSCSASRSLFPQRHNVQICVSLLLYSLHRSTTRNI
uniref:Uncharacterized protein n=1 Tax=Gasterosteus aculeatus TaxID=69293 RepID=G3PMW8_GASAC